LALLPPPFQIGLPKPFGAARERAKVFGAGEPTPLPQTTSPFPFPTSPLSLFPPSLPFPKGGAGRVRGGKGSGGEGWAGLGFFKVRVKRAARNLRLFVHISFRNLRSGSK